MEKLNTIKKLVREILEKDEKARNSDNYLYLMVLQNTAMKKQTPFPQDVTLEYFLLNMSNWGVPPFESVRRSRQKVQAECPHLCPCEKVSEYRAVNEEEYRAFARG